MAVVYLSTACLTSSCFVSDLFGDCIDSFSSGEDLVQCGPVKEDQGYDAQESCQKQKDADHAGFLHIL